MNTGRPVHANYAAYIAHHQKETEVRRARRERELKSDPERQEIRRIRAEIAAKEAADRAADEDEAAKHARVSCPYGFNAHVDRNFNTKASFLPYLERALREYENDHPDQVPGPVINPQQEAADRQEAESRYRARALDAATSRARLESLLSMRCAAMGQDELRARDEAKRRLSEIPADPHGGEHPVGEQDTPALAPIIEATDAEPFKRGRGRPSKAAKIIEMTDDGALFE